MADDWMAGFTQRLTPGRAVVDAMGAHVDGVIRAREVDGGVECVAYVSDAQGNEIVGSPDDGQTLEPVECLMRIPGGMILDIEEE